MMAARRRSSAPPRKETPGLSRALGRRPVGGGLEEAFDDSSIGDSDSPRRVLAHTAAHNGPEACSAGLTEFGSIRVAGDFLCGTEARE